jgi:hypothetical protein
MCAGEAGPPWMHAYDRVGQTCDRMGSLADMVIRYHAVCNNASVGWWYYCHGISL